MSQPKRLSRRTPGGPARRQSSIVNHRSSISVPFPAFTLVELLVVIFIIGSLIALLIPVVGKVKRASQGAATQAQMASIATAIQSYYSDFRAYPGPLPNSQVGITYYPTANYTNPPQSKYIYVYDSNAGTYTQLSFGLANLETVTGAENLVLGLLGGLEMTLSTATPPLITSFGYKAADIFPDGTTPNPIGASNLNPNQPKRFASYLQVRTGDISNSRNSSLTPTAFTDNAQRLANDSEIPEFLDKFSQPMPILYLRANPGATAVTGVGGGYTAQGTQLTDSSTGVAVVPQYDLAQIEGYTSSTIGTKANGTSIQNQHGLQMPPSGDARLNFGTGSGATAQAGFDH